MPDTKRPEDAASASGRVEHFGKQNGTESTQRNIQKEALLRLRRQRHVERICGVPRLVAELLDEIGRHHAIEDDIRARLERYAALDHGLLAALRADRFAPAPLRVVGDRR